LAVLDNCSNDGSAEWLASLGDSRIKVYPSSTPLSIEDNWARALEIPKNEFMTFFGHDDLMDANYLEVMDALIQREPEASLYFAHFRYIDKDGDLMRHCRPLPARETAAEYIKALFSGERDTYGSGYMMRSSLYHEVGGIPQHRKLLFADDTLWITLMHKSWKATAQEECFSIRLHPSSTGATAGIAWLDGMHSYITFLEELSKRDPKIAQAYAAYGPGYFRSYSYAVYQNAIVKATNNNQRLDPKLGEAIFTELTRVSPEVSQQLRHMKRVRAHAFINRYQLTRRIYQVYSFLRGGNKAK
jgi:hypothetical protein